MICLNENISLISCGEYMLVDSLKKKENISAALFSKVLVTLA